MRKAPRTRRKTGTRARTAPTTADWYQAFAEWRIEMQGPANTRNTVKYFRLSRNHTMIWTMVMRGHYTGHPPSIVDCIKATTCALETTRKIIITAEAKGYFVLRPSAEDTRKKLISPTDQCIAEYETMVDLFLQLADILPQIQKTKT